MMNKLDTLLGQLLYWSDNMTVKELKEILEKYPEDCLVMYRHNLYGRIDIDEIDYKEETLLTGVKFKALVLEGNFMEGEN